jgi:signal transduction histidine kinase
MGLGLASSYAIIRKHNGHITVESRLNEGTTFHIYLPAVQEKESEG